MGLRLRYRGLGMVMILASALVFLGSGCGYVKNAVEDFQDIIILGVGVTPPTFPLNKEANERVAGILPPSIGVYVEATEFCHLGGLLKGSCDLEWDRRGAGFVGDRRFKLGFGPAHYVDIYQQPLFKDADGAPLLINDYKVRGNTGNDLDAWREHMGDMKDFVFSRPAKQLIYDDNTKPLPFLQRGWQGWETFSVELAIPEPFITHSGFNVRAGINPCEVFDFALSLIGLDLYDDRAYNFWDGSVRLGTPADASAKQPNWLRRWLFRDP